MPLERVTDGLFDYAGMFPPAALSFENALLESANFPTKLGDPELLAADIVLTSENMEKMNADALHKAGFAGRDCTICLVGVAVDDAVEWANKIVDFNSSRSRESPAQKVISLELHFEDQSIVVIQDAIDGARKILRDHVALFLEPKWNDARMAAGLDGVMMILDGINQDSPKVGFKVRCDGPNALFHLTLAKVMAHVNRRSIPLKLTQGLHHPFVGDAKHNNAHGFLNCVFGLRLHRDSDLSVSELSELLADSNPDSFNWDDGLGWRDHHITIGSVDESAMAVPFTIGSCSIAEPDADLRELEG